MLGKLGTDHLRLLIVQASHREPDMHSLIYQGRSLKRDGIDIQAAFSACEDNSVITAAYTLVGARTGDRAIHVSTSQDIISLCEASLRQVHKAALESSGNITSERQLIILYNKFSDFRGDVYGIVSRAHNAVHELVVRRYNHGDILVCLPAGVADGVIACLDHNLDRSRWKRTKKVLSPGQIAEVVIGFGDMDDFVSEINYLDPPI